MKVLNWFLVILGISGLVAVRVVEDQLFYDPFLNFFHEANKHALFPDFDWGKLVINHLFRFLLNLLFSTVVVHCVFKNWNWTIQAAILISIVFAITFPIYLYCVYSKFEIGYLFSFYMRRFVIQPLILLLIIPMFYYRKHLTDLKTD
ncbi:MULTISPECIES: exosortase F system-associated membrane protein [Chryseobacterium]|uniref:exosortase F system-associated membrane protein n=1 Tax=Chryseobacterium sp. R2A-55 TaxID=2744445 RepID=UPI001F1F14B6|nr:exosortase F system-associated protein [Chryseobacterium sp. R2A-55]